MYKMQVNNDSLRRRALVTKTYKQMEIEKENKMLEEQLKMEGVDEVRVDIQIKDDQQSSSKYAFEEDEDEGEEKGVFMDYEEGVVGKKEFNQMMSGIDLNKK